MATMYQLFGETANTERPPTPLKHLLHLPSTADIEAELATLPRNINERQPSPQTVVHYQRRLDDAHRRDAIQGTRPDGCWCLGLGGDDERTTGDAEYLNKPCSCPEGLIAAQHKVMVRIAQQQRQRQAAIENLWENAQIPARFKDFRLGTSPLAKTSPLLLERLRPPPFPWDDIPNSPEPPEEVTEAYFSAAATWWASWFIYGPYGTGKTGLAVGMAWDRVVAHKEFEFRGTGDDVLDSVLFISAPRLFSELRSTYNRQEGPSEQEVIDRYAKVKLLILDDMGAENVKNADWLADRLYQIVGERHDELRPTIFTSNLSIAELARRVGERVTWRIVEMVAKNIVHLDGPNLRV